MSRWGGGVSIITTLDGQGGPCGFTASSFSSVSLDPPMVLFCLGLESSVTETFLKANAFAAHILSSKQQALSNQFAASGADRFEGLEIRSGYEGIPILAGSLAVLECRIVHRYPGGDHIIVVGEVEAVQVGEGNPLLYFKGQYETL